jgi:predicted GNAT superfamily acetyltransferase
MPRFTIRLLEKPEEMDAVIELQRIVWPGSETEVTPAHVLITAAHNGGLILGAYEEDILMGFVFGFPGIDMLPDGPQLKHCSHMLGVRPEARDAGLGFALKRAQWQMLRQQGLTHATWTYDPLLSRNAHLNIAKLGATCNTYLGSYYGELSDGLNIGLPSDRFQVDWWLISRRVERRLGKYPRGALSLNHLIQAGCQPLYALQPNQDDLLQPPEKIPHFSEKVLAVEIPPDFMALKASDMDLAHAWRFFTRVFFEAAFSSGYIVTDFIFDQGRSFYVLSHGESTLEGDL